MFKKNNLVFIVVLIALLVPGMLGLIHPGFPQTDDGGWMIIRFASFYESLRYGQFPTRFLMSLNHGYGYPVADFLYPLFMYLGVPIHVVGFGFINSIKIILAGSFLFSSLFTFFWLRKLFNQIAAFTGAVAYAFFPYHLFDIYQRGSVGEVVALGIVPFIFWQIERKSFLFVTVGISCLILSHNTLALLFLPTIIGYMVIQAQKTSNQHLGDHNGIASLKFAMTSVLLGLGLAAFFWIPALYDTQFTIFRSVKVSDFSQYFLSTKNFSLVGLFALMVSILCISFAFKKSSKHDLFFLFITYIGLFFSLPSSTFLWNLLPLPQLVQFPFRFLSVVILGVAFLTAYMIQSMKTSMKFIVMFLCLLMIFFSAWMYLFPKNFQLYPDSYYATNQDTTTVQNEYMPKWVRQIPQSSPQNLIEILKGDGVISQIISNNANTIRFRVHTNTEAIIRINIIYFPGWEIFVNNNLHYFLYNNPKGVMEISLPAGDYSVIAQFGETPIRQGADSISLLSFMILMISLVSPVKRFLKKKQ